MELIIASCSRRRPVLEGAVRRSETGVVRCEVIVIMVISMMRIIIVITIIVMCIFVISSSIMIIIIVIIMDGRRSRVPEQVKHLHRWNRNPRTQHQTFSKVVCLI